MLTLLIQTVSAQEKGALKLISLDKTELGDIKRSKQSSSKTLFTLDRNAVESGSIQEGSLIEIETTDNESNLLRVVSMESYIAGTISFIAKSEGIDKNLFIFTYSDGNIIGLMHQERGRDIHFSFEEDQTFMSKSISDVTNEILECGVDDHDFSNSTFSDLKESKLKSVGNAPNTSAMASLVEDVVTIDIIMAYTPKAFEWASTRGGINTVISQAMNFSQSALNESEVGVKLRLVHTYETAYDDDATATTGGDHLRRFTQNTANPVFNVPDFDNYMDEIHTFRNQYGADFASLIASEPNTGGIAWVLGSTAGSEAFGFSVNRVQQIASGYTVVHEFGHNMGNLHARNQNSQAAGARGGLFHYSVGYRDTLNNFNTIMAYAEGLQQAPYFSNPDIPWIGGPAGSNNSLNPANNARSMKEIKRVISAYRPSIVDAPVLDISTNSVAIQMNREDSETISLNIQNTGASDLIWDIDFRPAEGVAAKNISSSLESDIKAIEIDREINKANVPFVNNQKGKGTSSTENIVYSTSFETAEGFAPESYNAISLWRGSNNFKNVGISTANPKSGSNHMRLEKLVENSDIQFISSPFFGPQPYGDYEVSLDFAVSGTDVNSEIFDIYIYDSRTRSLSAAVLINQGILFTYQATESGFSFFGTGGTVPPNTYKNLRIVYNTLNETVDYYLDNVLVASNELLNGLSPDEMSILHRNQIVGSTIDIDNIENKQTGNPFKWLGLDKVGGVTQPAQATNFNLNFSTVGIDAGLYETILQVRTNDPNNPIFEIPLSLDVSTTVSNENISDLAKKITLDQNYPNPFNPTTNIRYTLNETDNVSLTVYNISGQMVASLVNERQLAGTKTVQFDASNLASGVYFYNLKTSSATITRQMVLIK